MSKTTRNFRYVIRLKGSNRPENKADYYAIECEHEGNIVRITCLNTNGSERYVTIAADAVLSIEDLGEPKIEQPM